MLQAKTNEQYRAFQNEIAYAEGEIRKSEDRILDLMSEAEALEANVKQAEAALAEEKKSVDAEKSRAKQRTETDRKRSRKPRPSARSWWNRSHATLMRCTIVSV